MVTFSKLRCTGVSVKPNVKPLMKIAFRYIAPCSFVKIDPVSDVRTASIIGAIIYDCLITTETPMFM
jgi:hypothetical protein